MTSVTHTAGNQCVSCHIPTTEFARILEAARFLDVSRRGKYLLFTVECFARALKRSAQPIKVKLLDQALVAGIGNIYASESLFRAGISPKTLARRLKVEQVARLWGAIREVLSEAIGWGSTVRLDFRGVLGRNRLFYDGSEPAPGGFNVERLQVYGHAGEPCRRCGRPIKRVIQAGRSTFYCPGCQTLR